MAKADLICWIDADDHVPPTYLESLLTRQREVNADIVCSRMVAFNDDSDCLYMIPNSISFDYSSQLPGKKAVMLTVGESWGLNINGFLVRRTIWKNTSIFLDINELHTHADDYSSREMLLMAERVAFVDVTYYYRVHGSSITHNATSKVYEILKADWMTIRLFKKYFENSRQCRQLIKPNKNTYEMSKGKK